VDIPVGFAASLAGETNRRGVPHGCHVHALHAGSREPLDELFLGFTEQVVWV
jgi:hypothetical protein